MLDRMKPLRDPGKQHVYRCHQCGWRWTSTLAHPPERCPNCHSRNWDTPHRRPRGRPRKARPGEATLAGESPTAARHWSLKERLLALGYADRLTRTARIRLGVQVSQAYRQDFGREPMMRVGRGPNGRRVTVYEAEALPLVDAVIRAALGEPSAGAPTGEGKAMTITCATCGKDSGASAELDDSALATLDREHWRAAVPQIGQPFRFYCPACWPAARPEEAQP